VFPTADWSRDPDQDIDQIALCREESSQIRTLLFRWFDSGRTRSFPEVIVPDDIVSQSSDNIWIDVISVLMDFHLAILSNG
jgi:hypothetical protein